jgi:hypothetical protein
MEIGTEAEQFLFWEHINGIFVAVNKKRDIKIRRYGGWKRDRDTK